MQNPVRQFQLIGELEHGFDILGAPGKVAVTPWLSRARMGTYDDAVRLARMTGKPADIAAVRRYRSRWGLAANLEQQVTPDWGVFLQFVNNPAYNRDRGPVSVLGLRLHAEF